MHIFPLPRAFVGPVSHLQTLLATHMLFVCLPVCDKKDKSELGWTMAVTTTVKKLQISTVAATFPCFQLSVNSLSRTGNCLSLNPVFEDTC